MECPECYSRTILFTGKGKDMQYKVCSRYKELGHKTEEEIKQVLLTVRRQINPSGRLA